MVSAVTECPCFCQAKGIKIWGKLLVKSKQVWCKLKGFSYPEMLKDVVVACFVTAAHFVTLVDLHCLHGLSPRHVLSQHGDKT